ncbi:PREDICTED: uncharacterized protein LOC104710682 isoform X2 [Camelina sativa]|uniref:Uncharacterized protein LOC104710682 isoform X2 n=1 Tax=Camelina sativa TaxID=90675 RepID=A0ABM0TFE8_CAMSA|nr:PREDICTED: uncharacterized protein LOC104710682 isoform X2 [Camelina sativa]
MSSVRPTCVVDASNVITESAAQVTDYAPADVSEVKSLVPFVPSLGAWGKPLKIPLDLKDPIPEFCLSSETAKITGNGLENQKEFLVGQLIRCYTPSRGVIHAVANRIWGKKCKIFTRKLVCRGGRSIKPTQKVQENEWTTVGRHGKHGCGGRGGRG